MTPDSTSPGSAAPLALTMGEPAGIGGEIALVAWRRHQRVPVFVLLDDPDRMRALAANLGFQVPVETVDTPEEAAEIFHRALPVLRVPLPCEVEPGRPQPAAAGPATASSIEQTIQMGHSEDQENR